MKIFKKMIDFSKKIEEVVLELGECRYLLKKSFKMIGEENLNYEIELDELMKLLFETNEKNTLSEEDFYKKYKFKKNNRIFEELLNDLGNNIDLNLCGELRDELFNQLPIIDHHNALVMAKTIQNELLDYSEWKIIKENHNYSKLFKLIERIIGNIKEISHEEIPIAFPLEHCSHKVLYLDSLGIINYLKEKYNLDSLKVAQILNVIMKEKNVDTIRRNIDALKDEGGSTKATKMNNMIFSKLKIKI